MAKFTMRTMPDLSGKGQEPTYPKLLVEGLATTDDLMAALERDSSFSSADIKGLLAGLASYLAQQMAEGRSVKLEGIGLFTATLGLVEGAEREQPQGPHRNAQSVCVRSVSFRPDSQLVARTRSACRLERAQPAARPPQVDGRQARLAMALAHLERHGLLRLADYVQLTGLARTSASLELRELLQEGLLGCTGRGSHRVYIKPSSHA